MMELLTMARTNNTKRAIAMTGLLAGLALAGATAFAQTDAPAKAGHPADAMTDHEMPDGQTGAMPGMMMNGEMQEKMTRMMDNCNRMMETMMQNQDRAPAKKS